MFPNRYDIGDIFASILLTYGIASFTGIGSSTVYGVSYADAAFSVGSVGVPFALLSVIVATAIAWVTNTQLTVEGLVSRPQWEQYAAAATVIIPVAFTFVSELHGWMTGSYYAGTAIAVVVLVGFVIVGYRRPNDKKLSLFEALHPAGDSDG